ncbi:ABC-2 type transport system ATP-binding protein [Hathewaya proteolytica DSM 3090]|uniref:ABC-2 type transport system ATP-binding protein n=1 Tax=Hathewaya proteolytica DSM 3090 TaxID=1121331 RepID=A0A1M6RCC7_9CLOT|nr:ATP-binding cassette domain-containing protein [Hathewaya proteolytica]SHK29998.1 ABC-2 type transport system ATP-binding protein [Hathewaya proteolytica DSM 3090]
MNNIILKTDNLCKTFKKQKAVDGISISVEENSIYGLPGPNGAGKSTILKMMTGMLRPTSGKIEFDGHTWRRNDLNKIGALIENPPIYENLTARENLKVRTRFFGLPDTRIDEVLKIVDLMDTGKKKSGNFSMGMKQRLGIAIALVNSPKLLILDEPTNGLDSIGIQELRKLCHEIRNRVDCPIIFLTAQTMENDVIDGLSEGADDYMTKPFLEQSSLFFF